MIDFEIEYNRAFYIDMDKGKHEDLYTIYDNKVECEIIQYCDLHDHGISVYYEILK